MALSGTESAILNPESGDLESCSLNRAIPRVLLAAEILAIPGLRLWSRAIHVFMPLGIAILFGTPSYLLAHSHFRI